jgi:hypothetical protein
MFDGGLPIEIACFAPSRGFGRQPPPRPPRRTIPVAAVLIGGPLMMLALVILGIAVGTMIAVLF